MRYVAIMIQSVLMLTGFYTFDLEDRLRDFVEFVHLNIMHRWLHTD